MGGRKLLNGGQRQEERVVVVVVVVRISKIKVVSSAEILPSINYPPSHPLFTLFLTPGLSTQLNSTSFLHIADLDLLRYIFSLSFIANAMKGKEILSKMKVPVSYSHP